MASLPTLRRQILRSFAFIIWLYAILGLLLLVSMKISGNTTPRLLHLNYDSISAASRMTQAWNAIQYPDYVSSSNSAENARKFGEALVFAEHNVTEPGEKEIVQAIRVGWESVHSGHVDAQSGELLRHRMEDLVAVNEKGMFALALANERLGSEVLIGTLIFFLISLVLAIFFADSFAERLSRPLKRIAEALHRSPGMNRKLHLPEPTNLEILLLTRELEKLWERLSESDRLNVTEILKQKTKLEALLECVEDGLLVLDQNGAVSHCNERFGKIIKLSAHQVIGRPWEDLPTLNENYLKLRATLREGMPEGQQIDLLWNDGPSYFSARSRKLEAAGKNDDRNSDTTHEKAIAGTLFLIHDITEKKQRDKFRSEFIDLLSHELKTPLQSLGTASELLTAQKSGFSDDTRILVDTISEDVERIRAVAQEFVQITQSQSKILKLKMDLVPLNQLLPEWIRPFSVVAKDRGVKIEFRQEGSEIIWARLDLVKFPWVISNILSNAVRFSPNGEAVSVLLTDRRGAVEVQIKDEGPGIPESEQGKVFEPFYQSPIATASGPRGLFGIGLTIAKEVVEAHDGRIEYHQVHPHGSEFRVLLPFPPVQYGGAEKAGVN